MLNNLCKVYFHNAFLLHKLHCCSYFVQNALFTAIFNSNVIRAWDDSSSSWKMLRRPWGEALAGMSSLFTEILYIFLSTHYGKPEIIEIYIKVVLEIYIPFNAFHVCHAQKIPETRRQPSWYPSNW